jgi:hypothetical protein
VKCVFGARDAQAKTHFINALADARPYRRKRPLAADDFVICRVKRFVERQKGLSVAGIQRRFANCFTDMKT